MTMLDPASSSNTPTGQRLLDGVVVIEVAHPLTEYAGMMLAGLGADVWLVEPPGGSLTRTRKPFTEKASESRRSIPFIARNLGKKSVVIDVGLEADRTRLVELLKRADVVIEHESSPYRHAVSFTDVPVVRVTDPDGLGVSSIVGFAASGALSSSGWPHQPPCNAPSWLALDTVGTFVAATAALLVRSARLSGEAAVCEIPYSEAAIAGLTGWTRTLYSYGMSSAGQGAETKRLGGGPFPIFPCKDGYVRVIAATPRQWTAFLQLLDEPEILMGEEWQSFQFRNENFDAIFFIASEIMGQRPVDEVFQRGQRLGLPITPVLDVPGVMNDAHVRERGLFGPINDPELGSLHVLRAPVRTNRPEDGFSISPAPQLGQHSDQVEQLPHRTQNAAGQLPDPVAPLHGLRVISLGVGAVVPEATSFLALLGAEVIKIESENGLDFFRQLGLDSGGGVNNTPTFNQANLGVKSCAINMATEEGRRIARLLVEKSDIIMENMRGTVMRKWGLDYESVRAINPNIIYVSSQGLGDGPYSGFTTYGPNLQSFAGMTTLWAHPDDPYPVGSTLSYPDHLAGRQALAALFGALIRRDTEGQGCYLDCAQFEVATMSIADKFLQHQLLPGTIASLGNKSLDVAPHGCFPCSGDDEWCAIAISNDDEWKRFTEAVGETWVNEPRFATNEQRLEHVEELHQLIAAWTSTMSPSEVEDRLREHRVPVSRIVDGASQSAHQGMHASGFYTAMGHPTVGVHWYTGMPFTINGQRAAARRAPLLGEHSEYVLLDVLGLDASTVSRLTEEGVVGS